MAHLYEKLRPCTSPVIPFADPPSGEANRISCFTRQTQLLPEGGTLWYETRFQGWGSRCRLRRYRDPVVIFLAGCSPKIEAVRVRRGKEHCRPSFFFLCGVVNLSFGCCNGKFYQGRRRFSFLPRDEEPCSWVSTCPACCTLCYICSACVLLPHQLRTAPREEEEEQRRLRLRRCSRVTTGWSSRPPFPPRSSIPTRYPNQHP